MRNVKRSALVPYSASQMFVLVDNIEVYPEFLPWCSDAVVHLRKADIVEATLELQRTGLRRRFRTRNTLRANEAIDLALIDGPFRHLAGGWRFADLGGSGCKVSLELEFELENRITDALLGPFFEEICNSLVDSFTRRARDIYGDSGDRDA